MKKLFFAFPIVALLAVGCNSSQQATVQTQTPVAQNTTSASAQQVVQSNPTTTTPNQATPTISNSALTVTLAPASDGITNPDKVPTNFSSSVAIGEFRTVNSAADKVTITSITLKANQSVGSNLPLTNLNITGFGKAIAGPIVAGQTYTFTGSDVIPAGGTDNLFIHVQGTGSIAGNYKTPFSLTNITGIGTTGGTQTFFSGNLNSQDITVVDQSAVMATIPIAQRDDQRVSDIGFMQGELEVYFSENNQYPNTLNDLLSDRGVQIGVSGTTIKIIPVPPEPADGSCTEQQNAYTYTRTSPTTFNLTFCLGMSNSWNSLSAGVHTASENHLVK